MSRGRLPRRSRHISWRRREPVWWDSLANGELLTAAEAAGFEVMVTTDRNLAYQQNLSGRRIALVVLTTPAWPSIRPRLSAIACQRRSDAGYLYRSGRSDPSSLMQAWRRVLQRPEAA